MSEVLRPAWIKDSMTIEDAARVAYWRNYTLKATWHPTMGLRVIAVPMEKEKRNESA